MYFHFVGQRRLDHWHGNTHVACQQWDFDAHVCWDMEVSKVMEVPPNHPFIDRIFPYKPSILGATPSHMEPPVVRDLFLYRNWRVSHLGLRWSWRKNVRSSGWTSTRPGIAWISSKAAGPLEWEVKATSLGSNVGMNGWMQLHDWKKIWWFPDIGVPPVIIHL